MRHWRHSRLKRTRSGKLSQYAAARLLAPTRFDFDALLIEPGIYEGAYSMDDLKRDLADLDKLRAIGALG